VIIYKMQKSGEATNFQFARKCPKGYKSIPGDRIPEDISVYHEKKYTDSQVLNDQERELLNLISENEYHLISRRFARDLPDWELKLDEWADQLAEVRAGKLVEIADKPF